jgi:hypothetical protein
LQGRCSVYGRLLIHILSPVFGIQLSNKSVEIIFKSLYHITKSKKVV